MNWTSRKRNGRRRSYQNKKDYCLPAVVTLFFLILFFWQGPLSGRFALPDFASEEVLSQSGGLREFQEDNPATEGEGIILFLQKVLGDTLPGLTPPPWSFETVLRGAAFSLFKGMTGADPRVPCSFLDRELGAGSGIHLPVFLDFPDHSLPESAAHPSPSTDPENPGNGEPGPVRPDYPFVPGSRPEILIYHTHITETFVPDAQMIYTENLELTVARLGAELALLLEEQYGLPLLHHTGVYDLPRHLSYEKARPALKQLLLENSDLRLVVDLHRDGVAREVTTVTLGGVTYGKILLVVGTGFPDYQYNLNVSLHLHRELESLLPGLSRGVRQQPFIYNQDLCPCSILVEVGGHENSLAEVSAALPFLAEALARTYYAFFQAG